MVWHWLGNKPLSEPIMVRLPTHLYVSLVLNELNVTRTHRMILCTHFPIIHMFPFNKTPLQCWHICIDREEFMTSDQILDKARNRACRPGGHYWDFYPGALSVNQVTTAHLKIRHLYTDAPSSYELKWLDHNSEYQFSISQFNSSAPPPKKKKKKNCCHFGRRQFQMHSIEWKLEQLECLHSEIPPAAPWLPILVIHIRSQVKRRWSQSYKFKKMPKIQILKFCNQLYTRHAIWSCLIRCINMKWIQPEL